MANSVLKSKRPKRLSCGQMSETKNQIIICVLDSDCCKRWAYVRDYYIRRKGKPGTGSGGEAEKNRSVLISFLDSLPSSQKLNTITKVVGDEVRDRLDESDFMEITHDDLEENIININEDINKNNGW